MDKTNRKGTLALSREKRTEMWNHLKQNTRSMGTILKRRRLQLKLKKSSEKGVRGKEAYKNPRNYDGAHF